MNVKYTEIIEQYGKFKITPGYGNLSDNLFLTPLMKKFQDIEVEVADEEVNISRAQVFNNLANVQIKKATEIIKTTPITRGKTHISQAILDYYGIEDINYLPFVKVTQEEIEWAKKFLEKFARAVKTAMGPRLARKIFGLAPTFLSRASEASRKASNGSESR